MCQPLTNVKANMDVQQQTPSHLAWVLSAAEALQMVTLVTHLDSLIHLNTHLRGRVFVLAKAQVRAVSLTRLTALSMFL